MPPSFEMGLRVLRHVSRLRIRVVLFFRACEFRSIGKQAISKAVAEDAAPARTELLCVGAPHVDSP